MPQLRLAADTPTTLLGEPAQQPEHRGDRVDGRAAQAFGFARFGAHTDEPVFDAPPALRPVRFAFLEREQHPLVVPGRGRGELLNPGGLHPVERRGKLRGVAGQIGAELTHVGEQRVLVGEEGLRGDLGGAQQLAEDEIETGSALGHVRQRRVEATQLPVDQFAVAGRVRIGEIVQVGEQIGEGQTRQRDVLPTGGQHVLHGAEHPVTGLPELVDVVPVAVLGERRRPGSVVAAFEHTPRVQLLEQGRDLGGIGHVVAARSGSRARTFSTSPACSSTE